MTGRHALLLADADVLVDYRDADRRVLARIAEHVGPLRLPTLVHDQVDGLSKRACRALGLELVEPALPELIAAHAIAPRLGLAEAVCLEMARARGWTLVLYDGALREAARERALRERHGLALLAELVRCGALTADDALAVARAMCDGNPVRLGDGVMDGFAGEVG